MSEHVWQRWRWTVACGVVVAMGWLALFAQGDAWRWFGVPHLPTYFADTTALLAAGEVAAAGGDSYAPNALDPLGRPHVYGPQWLWLGKLGLTTADTSWVGAAVVFAFLVSSAAVVRPRSPSEAAWLAVFLLSPPVLLGVERANNDLVIFVLLAMAGAALGRASVRGGVGGWTLIVGAAVLKFYPLVSLVVFAERPRWRRGAIGIASGMAVFFTAWWFQRDEFAAALSLAPRPSTVFAHGLPLLAQGWRQGEVERVWFVSGGIIGGLVVLALARGNWRGLWRAWPASGAENTWAVAGGSAWLLCFVGTSNHAYRAALLLLALPWWLRLARADDTRLRALGTRLIGLFAAACWCGVPKLWLWLAIHRQEGPMPLAREGTLFVFGMESMLWVGVAMALLVSLVGAMVRRRDAMESLADRAFESTCGEEKLAEVKR